MKIITRNTALASAIALSFGFSSLAVADTGNFDVSATVVASCHVDSAQNINFPAFDAFEGDSGTGDLDIRCTNGSGFSISLDYEGAMLRDGGTETLGYGLYSDIGHASLWNEVQTVSDTGTGSAATFTVFADVPADATAMVGTYMEQVNVTVTLD